MSRVLVAVVFHREVNAAVGREFFLNLCGAMDFRCNRLQVRLQARVFFNSLLRLIQVFISFCEMIPFLVAGPRWQHVGMARPEPRSLLFSRSFP